MQIHPNASQFATQNQGPQRRLDAAALAELTRKALPEKPRPASLAAAAAQLQTAPVQQPAAAAAPPVDPRPRNDANAQAERRPVRPGTHLDIRV